MKKWLSLAGGCRIEDLAGDEENFYDGQHRFLQMMKKKNT